MEQLELILQEAIQASEEHANEDWKDAALVAIESVAGCCEMLTTDEVWRVLGKNTDGTHNLSAIGPMMMRAARMGLIERTDMFRQSRAMGSCGGRGTAGKPIRVWRSLVYSPLGVAK